MKALSGIRVLDLTQHLAGPFCTMILGDLGAEIIKIEKIDGGDDQRKLSPFVNGESAPFMAVNRNKKSVLLNLKSPEGQRLFLDLAKQTDVVIENFRPGIVQNLGIHYEAVAEVNPDIVYCSISGYGQTGPNSRRGGFDIMAQGMTGLMNMNSTGAARPSKVPISINDLCAGLTSVYAILAACIHKMKTGEGQFVDVSLVDSGLALTAVEAASYFATGQVPLAEGTRSHLSAPYQAFRSQDGYVIVGAGNQKLWEAFCHDVAGHPEWIVDPRFATTSDRVRHVDQLEALVEQVFALHDTRHWIDRLEAAGVPGGPINSFGEALQDPHTIARGIVQEVHHPIAGRLQTLTMPARLSRTPGEIRQHAPVLGQNTDEVLSQLLGLTSEDMTRLRAERVIQGTAIAAREQASSIRRREPE